MREFMFDEEDEDDANNKILKICSINQEIINGFKNYDANGLDMYYQLNVNDKEFEKFMQKNEENLFQDITKYSQFQLNTDNVTSNVLIQLLFPNLKEFWVWSMMKFDEYQENMFILPFFITYFCVYLLMIFMSGMYYVSRIINVLLPLFVWIYVWYFDLWSDVVFIQWFSIILFAILSFFILLLFWDEFKIACWFRNIVPNHKIPSIDEKKSINIHVKRIKIYYKELKEIPKREQIIFDFFGQDIGTVIIRYLSRFSALDVDATICQHGIDKIDCNICSVSLV